MTSTVIIAVVASCIIAYFLCGIPFGLLITKMLCDEDVREKGSGNIGMTNAMRVGGWKVGALTLLFDSLKGVLAIFIGKAIIGASISQAFGTSSIIAIGAPYDYLVGYVFIAAMAGHIFSPFLHFKGGKGIATGFGTVLAIAPVAGLCLWIPFLVVAFLTRRISAGSVLAGASIPFALQLFYQPTFQFTGCAIIVAAMVLWAHRGNIERLIKHEERPFKFGKDKTLTGRG